MKFPKKGKKVLFSLKKQQNLIYFYYAIKLLISKNNSEKILQHCTFIVSTDFWKTISLDRPSVLPIWKILYNFRKLIAHDVPVLLQYRGAYTEKGMYNCHYTLVNTKMNCFLCRLYYFFRVFPDFLRTTEHMCTSKNLKKGICRAMLYKTK